MDEERRGECGGGREGMEARDLLCAGDDRCRNDDEEVCEEVGGGAALWV